MIAFFCVVCYITSLIGLKTKYEYGKRDLNPFGQMRIIGTDRNNWLETIIEKVDNPYKIINGVRNHEYKTEEEWIVGAVNRAKYIDDTKYADIYVEYYDTNIDGNYRQETVARKPLSGV